MSSMKMISQPSDASFGSMITDYILPLMSAMMSVEFMLFLFSVGAYMVLFKSRTSRPMPKHKKLCEEIDYYQETESSEVKATSVVDQEPTSISTIATEVLEEQQVQDVQLDDVQLDDAQPEPSFEIVDAPAVEVDSPIVANSQVDVFDQDEEAITLAKTDDAMSFNLRLEEYVQNNRFKEALELFAEKSAQALQLCPRTRILIIKLMSHAHELDTASMLLLEKSQFTGLLPPLVAVVARAAVKPDWCTNQIRLTGKLQQVRSACKGLKKHGFLNKSKDEKFQLNGHWVTEHGLNVVIEGKIVRWSPKRASKLKFLSNDRSSCSLAVYGESTTGRLVAPTIPDAIKSLKWDNGDVWHSFDGCRIAHEAVFAQSMTKVSRDDTWDEVVRTKTDARLQVVSKYGIGLLPNCLDQVLQFLGSDTYFVNVNFDCRGGPAWTSEQESTDFVNTISLRHPLVRFHHCWAEPSKGAFSQRAIMQGVEVDQDLLAAKKKDVIP